MLQAGIQAVWLMLYHYYIEQIGEMEKGYAKRVIVLALTFGSLLIVNLPFPGWGGLWHHLAGWLAVTGILLLYVLFYDGKPFKYQWWKALAPGLLMSVCSAALERLGMILGVRLALVLCTGAVLAVLLLMLGYERGHLHVWNGFLNLVAYVLLGMIYYVGSSARGWDGTVETWFFTGVLALELLLFFSLEGTLFAYQRGFEAQTEQFQRQILGHQYEEIREIYLNMRSWKHDYHNHLQVMKAQLAAGQAEEMKQYLDDLEQSLDSVDTYVRSGNLMADAILNSKLTLAEQKQIRVNCRAALPEKLSVEDVDLCVLLGNLLDNALEACEQIPQEQRFLRVYMVVNRFQLYISIQNSAKEELNFNERNYISQKRGNHGLGMKRVKALTDKYEGYLTLANEPGIFAAELTLPVW
ncbi:MAG: GHKL domain-containing protein [Lachnospiraceae bacterium]|nr:GHKL domain-containing protein [Butyrivibrio sp.]MCM1343825.1 GHKL domain-containing protein [Muribaculaceae bacterium]MCM1410983.1 GHKL domain-containing protein [Lachnospiraceae bacterium]